MPGTVLGSRDGTAEKIDEVPAFLQLKVDQERWDNDIIGPWRYGIDQISPFEWDDQIS